MSHGTLCEASSVLCQSSMFQTAQMIFKSSFLQTVVLFQKNENGKIIGPTNVYDPFENYIIDNKFERI